MFACIQKFRTNKHKNVYLILQKEKKIHCKIKTNKFMKNLLFSFCIQYPKSTFPIVHIHIHIYI